MRVKLLLSLLMCYKIPLGCNFVINDLTAYTTSSTIGWIGSKLEVSISSILTLTLQKYFYLFLDIVIYGLLWEYLLKNWSPSLIDRISTLDFALAWILQKIFLHIEYLLTSLFCNLINLGQWLALWLLYGFALMQLASYPIPSPNSLNIHSSIMLKTLTNILSGEVSSEHFLNGYCGHMFNLPHPWFAVLYLHFCLIVLNQQMPLIAATV